MLFKYIYKCYIPSIFIMSNYIIKTNIIIIFFITTKEHKYFVFGTLGQHGLSFEQQVGLAEEETMRNLAKEGSCVFIGRAADAVFVDDPGRISFFIHAPLQWRAVRVAQQYHLSESKAKSLTQQMDKKRASYYTERTDNKWAEAQTYHLSIDSSLLGTEGTVQQMLSFIRAVQDR